MPFDKSQRTTRRRSSAGPVPPRRPAANGPDRGYLNRQGPRPTFLALKDHGKVYVAGFTKGDMTGGSANNGGGSDGEEFSFPNVPVPADTCFYVASESVEFAAWFGFDPDFTSGAMAINATNGKRALSHRS